MGQSPSLVSLKEDLIVKSSVQVLEVFFSYFLFAQHDVVSKWQNTLF